MTQILLVEDDRLIGEMVRLNLEQDGYDVRWETQGKAAEHRLLSDEYDLAILDVNLPGRTGFELARRARDAGKATPILLLTARSDTASKVTGFDVGADDYLTKPFDVPELLARIRALLRRAGRESLPTTPATTIHIGEAEVDLQTGTVTATSGQSQIAPRDRRLLSLLWRRRNTALTLPEILEELGNDAEELGNDAEELGNDAEELGNDAEDGEVAASDAGAEASGITNLPAVREALLRLRDCLEPDPNLPRHFHLTASGVRFEG